MGKKALREFENTLDYVQGAIGGYRSGLNENLIPHGLAHVHEKLEAARKDLEALDLYERCHDALLKAEELIKLGPQHDEEAEKLILETSRTLMKASGAEDEFRRMYKAANDSSRA